MCKSAATSYNALHVIGAVTEYMQLAAPHTQHQHVFFQMHGILTTIDYKKLVQKLHNDHWQGLLCKAAHVQMVWHPGRQGFWWGGCCQCCADRAIKQCVQVTTGQVGMVIEGVQVVIGQVGAITECMQVTTAHMCR